MIKRTRAITGVAMCGNTICGDISVDVPSVSSSDVWAIARIISTDEWFTYQFPIVDGEVTINQPFLGDNAQISIVHSGQIEPGSEIAIQMGMGLKKSVFVGYIQDETQRETIDSGNILSQFNCVSKFEGLMHRYLVEGDQQSFTSSIKDSINQYIEMAAANIINRSNNETDFVSLQFDIWDMTLLDVISRIIADKCVMYIDGEQLIIDDISDDVIFQIDKNSKIVSYDYETSQEYSYHRCHVIGDNVVGDAYDEEITSKKEILIEDSSIKTEWDAITRAKSELEERNELTDAVQVELSDLICPNFGKVRVNLPGLNKTMEMKSIRYTINENGLYTTLYLNRSYEALRNIFKKIKE